MRRATRRATAARADTRWLTRAGDALSALTSVAVVVAVCGGTVSSLRDEIAERPSAESAVLPGAVTATAVAVGLVAGLTALSARLGPVSATPAVAAWWLPLPAARRGLLRGELLRVLGLAVGTALTAAVPVVLAGTAVRSLPDVLAGLVAAALLAAAVTGGLVVRQAGRWGRGVPAVAGALAALAVLVPALAGCVLAVTGGSWPAAAVPAGWGAAGPVGVAALAVLAGGALVLADRRLDRLPAGALRASGETAQYATASALSLDTRELGRALAGAVHAPSRPRTWRRVRGPVPAVVAADLAVLGRSPWRWGQLAVGAALPVLAARTEGLAELPALVAVAVVLGWALAAVSLGEPSRRASASPAADRSLPLAGREVVGARAVVPLAVLVVLCGVSALLVGQGSGAGPAWLALGVAAAPVWAAAAVRGGYRPELDWSGPVLSTPMGAVPTGVGATLVRGPDVGLLGTVPVALALLLGAPPWWLVAAQLVWSLVLAVPAVATAQRRG